MPEYKQKLDHETWIDIRRTAIDDALKEDMAAGRTYHGATDWIHELALDVAHSLTASLVHQYDLLSVFEAIDVPDGVTFDTQSNNPADRARDHLHDAILANIKRYLQDRDEAILTTIRLQVGFQQLLVSKPEYKGPSDIMFDFHRHMVNSDTDLPADVPWVETDADDNPVGIKTEAFNETHIRGLVVIDHSRDGLLSALDRWLRGIDDIEYPDG